MAHNLTVRLHPKLDLSVSYGADAMLRGSALCDALKAPKVELFTFCQGEGARIGVVTLAFEKAPAGVVTGSGAVRQVNRFRCKALGARGVALFFCAGCNGIYVENDPSAQPAPHCPWCDAQISLKLCDTGHAWGCCAVCLAEAPPFEPTRCHL